MANASRDQNNVPTLLGASSTDGVTPTLVYADPTSHRLLVQNAAALVVTKTITPIGTTGAQTINMGAGTVNFAAAATSLVVTNSLVTVNSLIFATVGTADATMTSVQAVAGAGSFTLSTLAAPTGTTRVNFLVIN